MSRSTGGLSYVIKPVDPASGDMRNMAHAKCPSCGVVGMVPIGGMRNNPEKIERLFIQRGWDFDRFNINRCLCERCVKNRAIRLAAESEAKRAQERTEQSKQARVLPTIKPPTGLMDAVRQGPQPHPKPAQGAPMPQKLTDLSVSQKASLRTAMESYFDADSGRWQSGYSDHKVSEETNIPRAIVTEFRDTFYGPIKDDPVVAALTDEIEQVRKILKNLNDTTLPRLEKKLDEYRKKIGL